MAFKKAGRSLTRCRSASPYSHDQRVLRRLRRRTKARKFQLPWVQRSRRRGRLIQNRMVKARRPPPGYAEPRRPREELPWWLLSKAELYALHREAGTLDIFFDLFPEP